MLFSYKITCYNIVIGEKGTKPGGDLISIAPSVAPSVPAGWSKNGCSELLQKSRIAALVCK